MIQLKHSNFSYMIPKATLGKSFVPDLGCPVVVASSLSKMELELLQCFRTERCIVFVLYCQQYHVVT